MFADRILTLLADFSVHPVDALFMGLDRMVAPYPTGVVPVEGRIPGTAFFPGGRGLWQPATDVVPPMPVGGVMVLGHDFHSEVAFRASLEQRTEVPDAPRNGYKMPATWIELRKLFAEAGLPLENCFFTNAYMGLRKGSQNIGRFPGASDRGFVDRCRAFFLRQVDVQRPSVIVTLGVSVPRFIAPLSEQLAHWKSARSMKTIDSSGPFTRDVRFVETGVSCSVIALTHPSLRGPNVGRRRYGRWSGHDAEVRMLREAVDVLQNRGGETRL